MPGALSRLLGGSTARVGAHLASDGLLICAFTTRGGRPELRHCDHLAHDALGRLDEVVRRAHARRGRAVVTLGPGLYQLFQIERPAVAAAEMRAAVRWRVRDLVDFPVEDASVDVFDVPPRRPDMEITHAFVAVARVSRLAEPVACVREARVNLAGIDIAELALRNLVERIAPADQPVMTVFVGRGGGIVMVTVGGMLCLARPLDIDFTALRGRGDAAGAEGLALELQRTVDYYDSHFGRGRIRTGYLLPADEGFADLIAELNRTLDMTMSAVSLDAFVDGADSVAADYLPDALLAVGGALENGA